MHTNPETDLTVAQAAVLCGVSEDTIRRRIRGFKGAAAIEGPYRLVAGDPNSEWRIPPYALVAAGMLKAEDAADAGSSLRVAEATLQLTQIADDRDRLEARVAHLSVRLADRDAEVQRLDRIVTQLMKLKAAG